MRLYTGTWIAVKSSTIAAYKIVFIESEEGHVDTVRLQVEFINGSTYEYKNVMLATVMGLVEATSKGQFFIRNIKGVNPFRSGTGKWVDPS